MKPTLLIELKANREYMTVVEKKIVDAIVADPKKFTGYSLGEFSKLAEVSQGSIVNFSNKFCGGGFPALKMGIVASMNGVHASNPSARDEHSLKAIFKETANGIYDALTNTLALNDEQTLKEIAEKIQIAKKVEIYGVFRSAAVATDFYFQLLQLGISTAFVSDVLTCAVSASMLGEDGLVFAISSSGKTQDVINAVRLAKTNGATIVAITADKNSPLAELAHYVLIAAPSGVTQENSATEIRLAQLALTDAICSYLRNKMHLDGSERYVKMSKILKTYDVKD